MTKPVSSSKLQPLVGYALLIVGVALFAVRLAHEGAYAVPRGANLFGGLGALLLGGVLVLPATPRWLGWLALAVSAGNSAKLRLWIVDREDGEWVGMPRRKALEHSHEADPNL